MRHAVAGSIAVLLLALTNPTDCAAQSGGDDPYSLRILGFTDINFSAVDGSGIDGVESSSGFRVGQLVLHFARPLSERWSFFAETATTAKSNGSFSQSFERVIARYAHSDLIKLSAGRYHTPVNYWNQAFHHGQWLQTSISRPEMTRFGGVFVPVHFVGLLEEGAVGVAGLELAWNAGIGNGRQSDIAGAGEGGDIDTHRAWLAGLTVRPDNLYRLQLGGSIYGDGVPLDDDGLAATQPRDVDELILAGHLVWHSENPEVIAEYARIDHAGLDGADDGVNEAWYGQLGWRLGWLQERLKPYARYESIEIDESDPIYGAMTVANPKHVTTTDYQIHDTEIFTAGLRIDVALLVALKGEYRRQRMEDGDWFDSYHAQLALTF